MWPKSYTQFYQLHNTRVKATISTVEYYYDHFIQILELLSSVSLYGILLATICFGNISE